LCYSPHSRHGKELQGQENTVRRELYVGNIPFEATDAELRKLFSVAGTVSTIHLITDPTSGKFRGCAYVKMASPDEAREAINSLDGALFIDRVITVSEARPQPPQERPTGSGRRGPRTGQAPRADQATRSGQGPRKGRR
jgi:RNA recognition motif-containing protein